jgi:hypothetical protein
MIAPIKADALIGRSDFTSPCGLLTITAGRAEHFASAIFLFSDDWFEKYA